MIPIGLVAGFLGSGKTTLLARWAERHRGRKLVYLVNDLGTVNVDTAWLEQHHERVASIPGGSIFCRCLVTEFLARLREVIERHDTPESPVEGVVIEASGMANPLVMADLLREGDPARRNLSPCAGGLRGRAEEHRAARRDAACRRVADPGGRRGLAEQGRPP